MISLTGPDGSKVTIDPKLVVRARRTLSGENPDARTRVDWAMISLVQEPIERVGPLLQAANAAFAALTASDGSKIWFNVLQAVGPLPFSPSLRSTTPRQPRLGEAR